MSIFLAVVIGFTACPVSVYAAKENKAYEVYLEAKNATMATDSWVENIVMDADVTMNKDRSTIKTKVKLMSDMNIADYSEENPANIKLSGSVEANMIGQTIAYDVLYENGIAHYEYTKPEEKELDLKLQPEYYDFHTLDEFILKKAKLSGNEITFKIPGNEMKDTGNAVMKMLPGLENVDYDDAEVELILNEETGTIESMIIDGKVSLTYQGYDAEMNCHITCTFQYGENENSADRGKILNGEEVQLEDGMYLYSDCTNLSIRKEETIDLSAGIVISGKWNDDVSGVTVTVSDASILDVEKADTIDGKRCVRLKGRSVGTTEVTFQDAISGYAASIPVTVYQDNSLSYTLQTVPGKDANGEYANFYNINGLYIDSYKYEINENKTAEVSFDVYNTNYAHGAVEVYREDGTIEKAILIQKMKSNNTDIKGALLDNTAMLIRDRFINKTIGTYKQETGFSKKTPVTVEIPENGYIRISNDPKISLVVALVNEGSMIVSFGKMVKSALKTEEEKKFTEKITLNLIAEEEKKQYAKVEKELTKKLCENVTKESLFSEKGIGNYFSTLEENLEEEGWEEIIFDTIKEVWRDTEWKTLKQFMGPAKAGFDIIFNTGKLENLSLQAMNFCDAMDTGAIYIQNPSENIRTSQQIKVECGKGFSDDTALNVFRVELAQDTLDKLQECAPAWYQELTNDSVYTYDISLLKNGEKIQPDGKVKVFIPIPEKIRFFAEFGGARVYRVETDGSLTKMETQIEGDCLVFDTEHFSVYTLIGNEKMKTYILAAGIVLVFFGFLLVLRAMLRKRKKNSKL